MNAGLDGMPEIDLRLVDGGGLPRPPRRLRPSLNLAYLVGNTALRIGAIGWEEVPATPAQLADMRAMLREAMEQGAIGVSSGPRLPARLVRRHRRAGGS